MEIPIHIPQKCFWVSLNSKSVKLALMLSACVHASILMKLISGTLFLSPTDAKTAGEYDVTNTMLVLNDEDFSEGTGNDYKSIGKAFLKRELTKSGTPEDLEKIKQRAKNISGDSLTAMAILLGAKSGEYIPRTIYHNEYNPNANLAASIITKAKHKDGVYTLCFEDKQKDTFSVDLPESVNETLRDTCWGGEPVADLAAGYELKGSYVTAIKKIDHNNCEVTLTNIPGDKLVMKIIGKQAAPFIKNRVRYMKRPDGTLFYPDDGTSLLRGKFDNNSTQVYDVKDITSEGGETTFIVTYIDKKGERLIQKHTGMQAEELRPLLKVTSDPTLKNIFQKTMVPILNKMMEKNK